MEGYCSTGQSPHWAVVPMEEEEEEGKEEQKEDMHSLFSCHSDGLYCDWPLQGEKHLP